MKLFFAVLVCFITGTTAFAQKDSTIHSKDTAMHAGKAPKKDWSKVLLGSGPADHLMIQFGYSSWSSVPDTIHITGFCRSFNFYFMFNFPFKSDPRLSVGAGLGMGWANVYFDKQEVLIAALNPTLAFPNEAASDHFKKYKLVSSYLDIPIELRFALDPEHMNSSWKFAVGTKVGLLLTSYTKAKDFQNVNNQDINNYIQKNVSNRYFNAYQFAATLRVSYGVIGVYGQYQLNPLIKSVAGPNVYPFEIGLVISGL